MRLMKRCMTIVIILSLLFFFSVKQCSAFVPVRISVNFIRGPGNQRPTGDISTNQDVINLTDVANEILQGVNSEIRLELVGIQDVWDDRYFDLSWGADNFLTVRNYARDTDPTGYHWRDNAVNVYINNGGGGSTTGITLWTIRFIGMSTDAFEDDLLHELGHVFRLVHTHAVNIGPNQDYCEDTLRDGPGWTLDQICIENFGRPWDLLTSAEQERVNIVWFNVMSYHNQGNRNRLSMCQLDRFSDGGDRMYDSWSVYTREPIYIDQFASSAGDGTWEKPYDILQAVPLGAVGGKTLVFREGNHLITGLVTISEPCILVPRLGPATIRTPNGMPIDDTSTYPECNECPDSNLSYQDMDDYMHLYALKHDDGVFYNELIISFMYIMGLMFLKRRRR